jgi:uncharacterized protein (DUF433 family)
MVFGSISNCASIDFLLNISLKILLTFVFMENYLERVTVNPKQLDGKPSIRNMRISVQTILEFLGAGNTAEEILDQYPSLQKEDILACLQYAAKVSGKEFSFQTLANA